MRTTKRTNKDGSMVKYLQLAHNERNPKTGVPAAKVIYNFGREELVDKDALRRLVLSIAKVLSDDETQAKLHIGSVIIKSDKAIGGTWLLEQLWRKLGIQSTLARLLAGRQFAAPMERAIFAMVANRALAPGSKLAMEDWVANDVAISELPEVQVHQLYRAMDFLIENGDGIQEAVFFSTANLLNLEVDLLYFDTTSTYFEVEPDDDDEEELRRLGHSKDHRPDLLQTVIGLAVTREGIPVRCWVWPGDTNDMEVIAEVKRDLSGWRLGRVITVVDRGFSSADNLKQLQRAGGHYIAGERMRAGMGSVEEALSRQGRYKIVKDNVEVKEIVIGDGEARSRYVLVKNPLEAEREQKRRDHTLELLDEQLNMLKPCKGDQHSKAVCALMASRRYGKYLKLGSDGIPQIDQVKVKQEARLDGKYLIKTSDDTLSPEDVALGYKQLLEVEDAFRSLKTTLDLRPVYHRLADRIRAHILICWLALLLVRVIETTVGDTWPRVRAHMQRLRIVEIESADGRAIQRTELTAAHRDILSKLGLEEPRRIHEIKLNNRSSV